MHQVSSHFSMVSWTSKVVSTSKTQLVVTNQSQIVVNAAALSDSQHSEQQQPNYSVGTHFRISDYKRLLANDSSYRLTAFDLIMCILNQFRGNNKHINIILICGLSESHAIRDFDNSRCVWIIST